MISVWSASGHLGLCGYVDYCGLQRRIYFSGIRGKKGFQPHSFSLALPWGPDGALWTVKGQKLTLILIFWKLHFATWYQEDITACWKSSLTKGCDRIMTKTSCLSYVPPFPLVSIKCRSTHEMMFLAQSSEKDGEGRLYCGKSQTLLYNQSPGYQDTNFVFFFFFPLPAVQCSAFSINKKGHTF